MPLSSSRGLPDAVDAATATKCPSCAESDLRAIGRLPAVDAFGGQDVGGMLPASGLFGCRACGLLFRYPVLPRSRYDALYGNVPPTSWPDQPGRVDWALIDEYVGRNSSPGASILDFGCHTGGLLRRLGSRYSLCGAEVNGRAAEVARKTTGAEVFESVEALPRGRQFDFVTAVDVVEHFADPGRLISSLLERVKPGGALIVTTGDAENILRRIAGARWWYCYYPEHLAFISEGWMRHWLRTTGLRAQIAEVRRFRYMPLAPLRFVREVTLTSVYCVMPQAYVWSVRWLKRVLARKGGVEPPGKGLSKDHVFVVLRKLS